MTPRFELVETIARLLSLADAAEMAPILFGAAVLELSGLGDLKANDLDVIADDAGARALARAAGLVPGEASGDDRFRSSVHLRIDGAPLVIDVMAELSVRTASGWQLYEPVEIVDIDVMGRRCRAVSLADLLRFYRLADRPKDLLKIAVIETGLALRR